MSRLKIVICGRQVADEIPIIASIEIRKGRRTLPELRAEIGIWLGMEQDEKIKFRFEQSGVDLWHVFLGQDAVGNTTTYWMDDMTVAGEVCRFIIEQMVVL